MMNSPRNPFLPEQVREAELQGRVTAKDNEINKLKMDLATKTAELKAATSTIRQQEERLAESNARIEELILGKQTAESKAFGITGQIESQLAAKNARIKELESNQKQLEDQMLKASSRMKNAAGQMQTKEKQQETMIREKEETIKTLQEQLLQVRVMVDGNTSKLVAQVASEMGTRIDEVRSTAQVSISQTHAHMESLQKRLVKREDEIEELRRQNAGLKQALDDEKQAAAKLQEKVERADKALTDKESVLQDTKEQRDQRISYLEAELAATHKLVGAHAANLERMRSAFVHAGRGSSVPISPVGGPAEGLSSWDIAATLIDPVTFPMPDAAPPVPIFSGPNPLGGAAGARAGAAGAPGPEGSPHQRAPPSEPALPSRGDPPSQRSHDAAPSDPSSTAHHPATSAAGALDPRQDLPSGNHAPEAARLDSLASLQMAAATLTEPIRWDAAASTSRTSPGNTASMAVPSSSQLPPQSSYGHANDGRLPGSVFTRGRGASPGMASNFSKAAQAGQKDMQYLEAEAMRNMQSLHNCQALLRNHMQELNLTLSSQKMNSVGQPIGSSGRMVGLPRSAGSGAGTGPPPHTTGNIRVGGLAGRLPPRQPQLVVEDGVVRWE